MQAGEGENLGSGEGTGPALARNFLQMVGRDLLLKNKENKKEGEKRGFVCLLPLFIMQGGWFSSEADSIGHFACRGAS